MMRTPFLLISALLLSYHIQAQDCNNPAPLCYVQFDNIVTDSTGNGDLLADYGSCGQTMMNGALYEITSVAPGAFQVVIQSVNCDTSNTSLEETIVMSTFTATDPCSPTLDSVSCQTTGSGLTQDFLADSAGQVFYVAIYGTEDVLGVQAFTTLLGNPVDIEGVGGVEEYQWTGNGDISNETAANPTVSPYSIGTFEYTVMGTQGDCVVEELVTVVVQPNVIPGNIITPNDDGINDEWYIFLLDETYEKVDIKVFTRWGQKVYQSIGYDYERLWDGTNDGKKLPAGAYYYVIELNVEGFDTEPITGAVSIIY
jgi:gliding motility-associated-like protein